MNKSEAINLGGCLVGIIIWLTPPLLIGTVLVLIGLACWKYVSQ